MIIVDANRETHDITKIFSRSVNKSGFKAVPLLDDDGNVTKYILVAEDYTFKNMAGELKITFGQQTKETFFTQNTYETKLRGDYTPGTTLTISSEEGEHGSVTLPNIKRINKEIVDPNSDSAQIVFKKLDINNNETVMTQLDFLELGWDSIVFEKINGNQEKYTFNCTTWSFEGNAGTASSDGKMTLPENGGYKLSIYHSCTGRDTETVYNSNIYPMNTSLFRKVKLGKIEGYYTLNYEESLDRLVEENAGKKFYIEVLDEDGNLIPRRAIDSSSCREDDHTQKFGSDLPLYLDEYIKVRVHIYCEETGLNEEIELDVPKINNGSDLFVKISAPGKVSLYGKTEDGTTLPISKKELLKILGYEENSNTSGINLLYEVGGQKHVLESIEGMRNSDNTTTIEFKNLTDVEYNYMYNRNNFNSNNITPEELIVLMNQIKVFYDYYNAVVIEDRPLFVTVDNANATTVTLPVVLDSNQGGERPYFEAISGIELSDYESFLEDIEALIAEVATLVEDGGTLELSAEEEEKIFYLNNGGIYYVEVTIGTSNGEPYICVPHIKPSYELRILKAGKLTGEMEENKALGQFVYYNSENGAVTFGEDENLANCYPLIGGSLYKIKNYVNSDMTVKFKWVDINGNGSSYDLVEITNEKANNPYTWASQNAGGYTAVKKGYILAPNYSLFEMLGRMIAIFVRSLANGLNYVVQWALQAVGGAEYTSTVNIDTIIFNEYPDTSIAFFKSSTGGDNPSKMIRLFRDGINDWYSVFRGIAIAGYLVVLLYIGVRILLSVGGQAQEKYKEMLTNWLVGIILLIFFPYVIKYMIEVNNVLVGMIADARSGALHVADITSSVNMSNFESLPEGEDEFNAIKNQMDENPFPANDNSYMAVMAQKAHESGNLVDAVVYLIMVFQFITIVIMYYKRVFTVAFLIAIFPFVTLSYAIDKIGDGKAQAFNTWSKELISNIFVQTIHAIIYVFVIAATYTEGVYSGDWLLSIIGITFLFKGEEIFKKIIGQEGQTVKNLRETAQRTVATIAATKLVTKNVADNFIGAGSHLGRSVTMFRQWRTETKTARNMDFLAPTTPRTPNAGETLDTYNPTLSGNADYTQLADDIQKVNEPENLSEEEYTDALSNVLDNRDNPDPNIQNLMLSLNLSRSQLSELGNLQQSVINKYVTYDSEMIANKENSAKYKKMKDSIDADIEAKLKIILPGNTVATQEKRAYMKCAMYNTMSTGTRDKKHKTRDTTKMGIMTEIKNAKDKRDTFYNPTEASSRGVSNPFAEQAAVPALSANAASMRDSILSVYYTKNMSNATEEEVNMAESLSILKDFSNLSKGGTTHRYTAKQVMTAARYVAKHENDSKATRNAVRNVLGVSGEEAKSIVAEEVTRRYAKDPKNVPYSKKIESKVSIPSSATNIEKKVITQNTKEALEMAVEEIKKDKEDSEAVDGVGVKSYLEMEREGTKPRDFAEDIVKLRLRRNHQEARMVEDLAKEQLDDLPKIQTEPTYEGLTKEEHEKLADDYKWKFVEEATRTGTTISTAAVGASIGAGLNIGLSDSESAVSEALSGAAGGIIAGDTLAETAIGRETKTKKLNILNPYTNEIEEFEVKRDGVTSDLKAWSELVQIEETIRADDTRLIEFNYNLDRQYLEHKQQKQKKLESQRRIELLNEIINSKNKRK